MVITGAGSGTGLAAAVELAKRGWRIGLIGRGEAALKDAARRVTALGGVALVQQADVSNGVALDAASKHIEAAIGPIDVWVNNAGIGFYGTFTDVPQAAQRQSDLCPPTTKPPSKGADDTNAIRDCTKRRLNVS